MAEWLVEDGIAEQRAIRLHRDDIAAARIYWPGSLTSGQIADAQLIARSAGSTRGTARFASGEEALVDRLPKQVSEGAMVRLEVIRASISEAGRTKLAHARPTDKSLQPAPDLATALEAEGHSVKRVHCFPTADWDDLVGEAFTGQIAFDGGNLHLSPTPAMTLIDIDGPLPPRALALAAVPAIAATLRRLDMGGSIGIDFPTLQEKADRRAVDESLAAALADWSHERTAMNGFGFIQIVARLQRPSLLQRVTRSPARAGACLLLRRAERVAEPGTLLLTCHPTVETQISDAMRAELARRTGREIRTHANPALALDGGFAQAIFL